MSSPSIGNKLNHNESNTISFTLPLPPRDKISPSQLVQQTLPSIPEVPPKKSLDEVFRAFGAFNGSAVGTKWWGEIRAKINGLPLSTFIVKKEETKEEKK